MRKKAVDEKTPLIPKPRSRHTIRRFGVTLNNAGFAASTTFNLLNLVVELPISLIVTFIIFLLTAFGVWFDLDQQSANYESTKEKTIELDKSSELIEDVLKNIQDIRNTLERLGKPNSRNSILESAVRSTRTLTSIEYPVVHSKKVALTYLFSYFSTVVAFSKFSLKFIEITQLQDFLIGLVIFIEIVINYFLYKDTSNNDISNRSVFSQLGQRQQNLENALNSLKGALHEIDKIRRNSPSSTPRSSPSLPPALTQDETVSREPQNKSDPQSEKKFLRRQYLRIPERFAIGSSLLTSILEVEGMITHGDDPNTYVLIPSAISAGAIGLLFSYWGYREIETVRQKQDAISELFRKTSNLVSNAERVDEKSKIIKNEVNNLLSSKRFSLREFV